MSRFLAWLRDSKRERSYLTCTRCGEGFESSGLFDIRHESTLDGVACDGIGVTA